MVFPHGSCWVLLKTVRCKLNPSSFPPRVLNQTLQIFTFLLLRNSVNANRKYLFIYTAWIPNCSVCRQERSGTELICMLPSLSGADRPLALLQYLGTLSARTMSNPHSWCVPARVPVHCQRCVLFLSLCSAGCQWCQLTQA